MTLSLIPRGTRSLSPFFRGGPLSSLREEMDELLSRFLSGNAGNGGELTFDAVGPSLDVSETDNEIQVKLDAPGMKPEELDIEITGDLIRISGEHTEEKEEKERKYHRVERRTGSFARLVRLPCSVNEENVDAQYHDGVLTVTLGKTEDAKAHKIPIKG